MSLLYNGEQPLGLRPISGHRNHAVSAADQSIRTTVAPVETVRHHAHRPGLRYLRVTGAITQVVLRNITTAANIATFEVAAGSGEIEIRNYGPWSDGVANWPARGQELGYSTTATGAHSVDWVSEELE